MAIARAPGKLVISGAYAVLEGAPALVTAVDRYAVADSSKPVSFHTPEVATCLDRREAPDVDPSALREGDLKLGLGSSAAILVASLAAHRKHHHPSATDEAIQRWAFPVCAVAAPAGAGARRRGIPG